MILLIAGHETTANCKEISGIFLENLIFLIAMVWILYELAKNQDWLQKVKIEATTVKKKKFLTRKNFFFFRL